MTGRLRTPRGLLDPGAPDRVALAASRGADWELTASTVEHLGDEPGVGALAWRWAAALQARWSLAIDGAGGDPAARAALRGIVTRRSRRGPRRARSRAGVRVGIYHVLSVSAACTSRSSPGSRSRCCAGSSPASPWGGRIAARAVGGAARARARGRVHAGHRRAARDVALRSSVVAVVLVGAMLDRPVRLVDALGVAAIVVLAWRPGDLCDPSFQLSFVAALTLALAPPTRRALAALSRLARTGAWLARGAMTSAWVALTTAPITAYHFHQVAAGGVIGNLVLTPLVELVALPLALAGLVIGEVVPALGGAVVHVAAWLVALVDRGAACSRPRSRSGRCRSRPR